MSYAVDYNKIYADCEDGQSFVLLYGQASGAAIQKCVNHGGLKNMRQTAEIGTYTETTFENQALTIGTDNNLN